MLKDKIVNLMLRTDAFSVFRFMNREKTPILMYHRFSEQESPAATSSDALERHLKYLKEHFNIISLAELADARRTGRQLPERAAAITIDDGYADAFKIAMPVFERFEVPATLFVVTDFLDKKCWIWTDKARFILLNSGRDRVETSFADKQISFAINGKASRLAAADRINSELKKMPMNVREEKLAEIAEAASLNVPSLPPAEFSPITWDQAREMDRGMISIASHTRTHPILTNCTDQELADELTSSKAAVENELQRESKLFCYPNGNFTERERDAVAAAGYDCAVTTQLRLSTAADDALLLPRVDAESGVARFAQAVSGFDEVKALIR